MMSSVPPCGSGWASRCVPTGLVVVTGPPGAVAQGGAVQPWTPWATMRPSARWAGGGTVTHDACCDRLLGAARAAGFRALREQVVPELASQTRAEPRVDVDAWGLAAAPRVLLDFTVCAPFAAR